MAKRDLFNGVSFPTLLRRDKRVKCPRTDWWFAFEQRSVFGKNFGNRKADPKVLRGPRIQRVLLLGVQVEIV